MCRANNLLWVNESECLRLALRIETDAGQATHSPAGLDISIAREPSHPEKIDPSGRVIAEFRATVLDIRVKYTNDLCVPVRVGVLDIFV